MTQQEIVREIERHPLSDRLAIIASVALGARQRNGELKSDQRVRRGVPVEQARGIAKPSVGSPPNDTEADQIRFEYLSEKYG